MPAIPVLRSLRQENLEFEAILGYIVRLSQKRKQEKTIGRKKLQSLQQRSKNKEKLII
jgi:hypothetical protein